MEGKMIKITLITGHFYPEIHPRAFRSFELAREMAVLGHDVTVICLRKYDNFDESAFAKENSFKLIIFPFFRVKSISTRVSFEGRNISKSLKDFLIYYLGGKLFYNSIKLFFKLINNLQTDLVISISTPFFVHFGSSLAIRIKKNSTKYSIVSFADCGDPYSKSEQFPMPFYFQPIEKFVLKPFDHILLPSKKSVSAYSNIVSPNKINIVPQGFKIEKYSHNYRPNYTITFSYAGVFYWDIRNPTNLFDKLSALNINFKFIIFLREYDPYFIETFLPKYSSEFRDKIQVFYGMPRTELLFNLSKMDFLINISNLTSTQVPSKLIDYAITSRPILEISSMDQKLSTLDEFLIRDFSKTLCIDLDEYNIEKICYKIINLYYKNRSN